MAEPSLTVYYKRTSIHNRLGQWNEVDRPYSQWIQEYFRQPIRDEIVTVVGRDEDGDRAVFHCMAETNDKISGITTDNLRIEIIQCREDDVDEVLARYP